MRTSRNFIASYGRSSYIIAALTMGFLPIASTPVSADTIQIFNATGTFDDSAVLSGTVTIDETTGVATAVNLDISSLSPQGLTFVQFQGLLHTSGLGFPYLIRAGSLPTDFLLPYFDLEVPLHSLVGYAGGPICPLACSGDGSTLYESSNFLVSLVSGSLSASAAPEPSTLLMFLSLFPVCLVSYALYNAPHRLQEGRRSLRNPESCGGPIT